MNKLLAGFINPDASITNPAFKGTALENILIAGSPAEFFNRLIPNLITLSFVIGALYFVAMIILGAISWISSSGDKQALESARSRISSAFIGLVILFSLFAVLAVIETFFGIDILTLDIAPLVIQ